jgi:segregation and condensation protein B
MDRAKQIQIVEALIVAAPEPIPAQRLASIVPGLTPAGARELVAELGREYERQDRAFEIWEVAGGYQIRTRAEYAGYVRELHQERPLRLSRAALETLAVIAYKQPVTRAEIEHVRGVDVGAVLRGLVDRKLARIAGHRDVPGHPMLYGTTRRFLEVFGLSRLEDLPTLREIEDFLKDSQGVALDPEPEGDAPDAAGTDDAPEHDASSAPAGFSEGAGEFH